MPVPWIAALLTGCTADVVPTPVADPREDDAASGCEDGADSDGDGAIDCDDPDCAAVPACAADTDTDTDTDPGDCANDLCAGLARVDLTYRFTLTVVAVGSCSMDFVGGGTLSAGAEDRVRFTGTYERVASDCNPQLDSALWWPEDGLADHTFDFAPDRSQVLAWYAHGPGTDPTETDEVFYITEMQAPIDLAVAAPAFVHTLTDGDAFASGLHEVSATFTP